MLCMFEHRSSYNATGFLYSFLLCQLYGYSFFFFERTNAVWLFLSHQYLQFAAITCLLSTVACEPDGELIDPASAGL